VSARAGIVVTGTEVLTGRVLDRNGGWISERLADVGIDHAHTIVVADRDADMRAALAFFRDGGMDLIVTSGGLGPTEDDRTAEIVGEFQGREMVLDAATEEKIAAILRRLRRRWAGLDDAAILAANRKQAVVPVGAEILDPIGTAPGLVVPPADGSTGPVVVVLPGPPRELQPMWQTVLESPLFRAVLARATEYRTQMLRLFGIPESEIASTLRGAREAGIDIDALEITTCLRRGEIEVVTRWEPAHDAVYDAFAGFVRERHADTLFSDDGRTIDELVAELLRTSGRTVATCESCTGGLLGGRLTELAGSSDYYPGGLVTYANEAKTALAGVPAELIDQVGAVSAEVAEAMADGARRALDASIGIGITGVAGPGGGSEDKPVGTVWFSVSDDAGRLTRRVLLPGSRSDIRDRATTVALHLLRRLLLDERDDPGAAQTTV
jgi:nicotinamide-nucleotide amidase